MKYIHLKTRALVKITGNDAAKFLQGLITNDINKLEQGAIYATMLTPQGKFLFEFIIFKIDGDIYLDCYKLTIELLIKKLNMYKLGSDVNITALDDNIYALMDDIGGDPRNPNMPARIHGDKPKGEELPYHVYEKLRINHGLVESQDLEYEKSFIMEHNFEQMNAIDYNKGCYMGQETVARSHYRGNVRNKVYVVQGNNLPALHKEIRHEGKKVGVMLSSINDKGLAKLNIEFIKNNADLLDFSINYIQ